MPGVPTHINFLCDSEELAINCTRGDVNLALCRSCGLISNTAFDPKRLQYREGYENSLHYSSVFQEYASTLADRLIDEFDLHGKSIVEIGCGQGHFLHMLCERGSNRGVGFDPSYTESIDGPPPGDRVRFVKDLYSDRYADVDADFILSRQTLEHVHNPNDMLSPLRRSVSGRANTPVFFEVPNGSYTLKHLFIWDIIYEHTSYFTIPSLETTLARAGFRLTDSYETFDGQYLCATAYPDGEDLPTQLDTVAGREIESQIDRFESGYCGYVESWRAQLDELASSGKSTVLWGAGSKGVTFLNMFDARAQIRLVVDVNPNKHGMYIAGQGQRIVPPEHLAEIRADAIIVANPIYKHEIADTTANLGLEPEFLYL
jgi:SAM-dependent methyltransferase